MDGLAAVTEQWVEQGSRAKKIPVGSAFECEEITGGPLATQRFLQLLKINFQYQQKTGKARRLGTRWQDAFGKECIPVLPDPKLHDPLLFMGFKAYVRAEPKPDNPLSDNAKETISGGVILILGAGNVSSIPLTDALTKLFLERRCVLLKMNPVNAYLTPLFEKAFAPLIREGYLTFIQGGADVGAYATNHDLVHAVHITGSSQSHDTIVWGADRQEREQRVRENRPKLQKEITSELGNVTPWIVTPGPYSRREIAFQAESIATSIVNNASFNCIATKVVLTWKQWDQREAMMSQLERVLKETDRRVPYYPGARDRFRRFAPNVSIADHETTLPWTLIRNLDPGHAPQYLEEESFVCVCVEVAIDAKSDIDFLQKATSFANDKLWGTLAAGITVHPRFRRDPERERHFQETLDQLRYGVVGINHWVGVAFAMMGIPWGGYPGQSLKDPQSGLGWVHNAYQLSNIEKSIFEGPLTVFPKPIWLPTHKNPSPVAWSLLDHYHQPTLWKLLKVMAKAMT